ncbi:hypothetical protein NDU88_002508 [Pleurodeles waltl]|uniref:Uncharacterized protein n=1 Tax=Pleurodeles waltl TaxID=8319 RepID=A0AAV7L3S0_PLEWA|nr:hypothetical protein NDU88_002508 [Pleurodeles waltl]
MKSVMVSLNCARGPGGLWTSVPCGRVFHVDLEVYVFGCEGGVFGGDRDVDGVPVDDGDSSSGLVDAVLPGDLVAVGDGYGDVRSRGGVHPGFCDEGDVWCCCVQEVP